MPSPPRVLLVDNYDSFTFNLAQLVAELVGAPPRVVRNDERSIEELLADPPDALILSPGPGSPDRPSDIGVCRALVERMVDLPVLGVCLGHQVIGAALGARVVHAPEPRHGRLSSIRHDGRGLFAGLPAPLAVVRYHSLVIDRATLPPSLTVTAETDDGLVMGIAHRERPLFGVQFHPESILTEGGRALLANFLAHATPRPMLHRTIVDLAPSPQSSPRRRERFREVPWVDPERAFVGLFGEAETAFWLDGSGRFSYMGAGSAVLQSAARRIELCTNGSIVQHEGDPFAFLEALLAEEAVSDGDARPDIALASGWVGCLGYELKAFAGGDPGPRAADTPDLLLMRADRVLAFDREAGTLTLTARLAPDEPDAIAERWFDDTAARLAALPPTPPIVPPEAPTPIHFRVDRGERAYLDDVARIHQHLRDGETYEICLTTQIRAPRAGLDPLALHRVLRRSNPAPYGAFLRFPACAIVSASPERFVHVGEDGSVESRPIKGTRPRGRTPEEDARLAADLAAAEKDRAENLMIVDLVRNDLGRVCAPGSVHVPRLMEVEAHPSVFQLVSTVRGRLQPDVSSVEAVRALFPGGSMTGAPKIRSMRIIAELERAPRGLYSGGLGFFSARGAVDLAMTIRTVVFCGDELSFGVGGAVVALSEARAEYEEALAKGRALMRAIRIARGEPPLDDERPA